MRTYLYEGKEYRSLRSLCKDLGLEYGTVYLRLKKGMSLEDAVSKAPETPGIPVIYNGKEFRTMKDFCLALDLPYHYVISRLKVGESPEQIVKDAESRISRPHNRVEFNRVFYKSYRELAEDYGVNYLTMMKRLERGHSLQEAVFPPWSMNTVNYNGVDYKSYRDLARSYGLAPGVFFYRFRKMGTIKDALEGPQDRLINYNGKTYPSYKALCESLGISYSTYRGRILRGMSFDEAVSRKNYKNRKIVYNNKTYNTITSLAKELGVDTPTLSNKIRRNGIDGDIVPLPDRRVSVFYEGIKYKSVKEFTDHYHLIYHKVLKAVNKGISPKDIINDPLLKLPKDV